MGYFSAIFLILWRAMLIYLVFALTTSTIPWIFQRKAAARLLKKLKTTSDDHGNLAADSWAAGTDRVLLVESTKDSFAVRVQMLRCAVRSIDLVYHSIRRGAATDVLLGELLLAADRGVRVNILIDAKTGADGASRPLFRALAAHSNIQVRRYNPVRLLKPWCWHALMHDKFILADQKYTLVGGRNLGDRYFAPKGYQQQVTNDRDVWVWNQGAASESVVFQLSAYMKRLWESEPVTAFAAKQDTALCAWLRSHAADFAEQNQEFYCHGLAEYQRRSLPASAVTLVCNPVHTGIKQPWIGYRLREMALKARHQVLLQTPYSTANRYFLDALSQMSRQADVVFVTNSMAASPNFPAFSNYYSRRRRFLATGIQLWEYQSVHSIHGKSMVIDDRLSAVGSFNMDDRSLFIDTEIMLLIDSPAFAAVLTEAINQYKSQSLQVGSDNAYLPSQAVEAVSVPLIKQAGMALFSVISRLFQFLI